MSLASTDIAHAKKMLMTMPLRRHRNIEQNYELLCEEQSKLYKSGRNRNMQFHGRWQREKWSQMNVFSYLNTRILTRNLKETTYP